MALKITEDFNKARLVDMRTSPTPQQPPSGALSAISWECPPSHLWKLNVDAAVDRSNSMRIGVVVRDSLGKIATAATWNLEMYLSPSEAEAFACVLGLKLAHECCFFEIVLESDNIE
ncbi:hypothetical protein PIB30_045539, partial [Stylosanthes scabra]|nr:hypothetical protein [Stylosanthes scabra]